MKDKHASKSASGYSGQTDPMSAKTALEIVENNRRRWILYYLSERVSEAPLCEIVEFLVACENEKRTNYPSEAYRRMYIAVDQTHLKRLKRHDLITETGTDRVVSCCAMPLIVQKLIRQLTNENGLPD